MGRKVAFKIRRTNLVIKKTTVYVRDRRTNKHLGNNEVFRQWLDAAEDATRQARTENFEELEKRRTENHTR